MNNAHNVYDTLQAAAKGLVGDKRNLPSSSMASASGVSPGSSRELYELAKAAPFYTDLNRIEILNLCRIVYK